MQTAPTNFQSYFEASDHSAQYKLVINGVDYTAEHIQTAPRLVRPMMDKPVIGRVCSATLTVTVRERENITIPKAATVDLYCRMARADGRVSGWLALGKFLVSSRKIKKSLITLTCRDYMLKTGRTYLDKTAITTWPQTYQAVAEDIASIIGVTLDSRCSFKTGTGFAVDAFPDDILMSEMLAGIAVCNGGNWIMTETGQLRLVPFTKPSASLTGVINRKMMGFTLYEAGVQTISRVILTAHEGEEEYTAGNDTGYTLEASCPFANQTVADYLCNTTDGILKGVTYLPCKMDKAPINPRIELGDSLFLTVGNGSDYHDYNDYQIVVHSMDSTCNPDFQTDVASNFPSETEDEYPYDTVTETQAKRTVTTNGVYYGNSITHTDGFKSVHESGAYAQFNANTLKFVDANGRECFYYDTTDNTFRINVEELDIISEKLDNIGGTNLIRNTFDPASLPQDANGYIALDYCPRLVGQPHNSLNNYWLCTPATHGVKMNRTSNASTSILNYTFGSTDSTRDYYGMQGLIAGQTYTFSADMSWRLLTSATTTPAYVTVRLRWFDSNDDSTRVYTWEHLITPATEQSARAVGTFTIPSEAVAIALQIIVTYEGGTSAPDASAYPVGDWLQMDNMKLENGEIATAWSPAPEDQVGNEQIISKINVSPEAIQIAANKISLAGKTIDLTSDTITIQSTNFSVTPAGIITATGVNLTGTFNMTGGTINVTTQSETYDTIRLNYTDFTAELAPIQLKLSNTDINRLIAAQAGGIFGYCVENGVEQQHFALSSLGNLYLGGETYRGHLTITGLRHSAISLFAGQNGGSDMYLYNYDPDHSSSAGGYVIRLYAMPNDGGTIILRDNSYYQSIYLNGQSHTLSINDLTGTGRISLTGSQGSVSVKGTGSYYTGLLSGGTSSTSGGLLQLFKADGTNTVILNGTTGTFTFTGTSNILSYAESGGLNLSHNSKHSIILWPDSNGAGRLVLGDGASTLWRTALTNDGLTFRNSSDAVTASYPASGLSVLRGNANSENVEGGVIAVPYVTAATLGISGSASIVDVSKAWAAYVAQQFPNKHNTTFIGTVLANSVRMMQMFAYGTYSSELDSNGVPRYCEVTMTFYNGATAYFSAAVGTYTHRITNDPTNGLFYKDANGVTTANYPASGLYLGDLTSKNIFVPSMQRVYEAYGVTIAAKGDGTYTIKGVCTTSFNINIGQVALTAGTQYIITGATGGSASTAYLNIPSTANDTGSGSGSFTVSSSANYNLRILVIAGSTNLNLTFSPMVRRADTSATFERWVATAQDNRLRYLSGSMATYVQNAGTVSFQLAQGVYLLSIGRWNTTSSSMGGLYLISAYPSGSSFVKDISASSNASVSIASGGILTVTTTTNYCELSIIQLN